MLSSTVLTVEVTPVEPEELNAPLKFAVTPSVPNVEFWLTVEVPDPPPGRLSEAEAVLSKPPKSIETRRSISTMSPPPLTVAST